MRRSSTANRAFTSSLALWCFQQRGVLRATNFRHHHIGSDEQPSTYRVSDDVEVLVDVVEITGGVETPFRCGMNQPEVASVVAIVAFVLVYWRVVMGVPCLMSGRWCCGKPAKRVFHCYVSFSAEEHCDFIRKGLLVSQQGRYDPFIHCMLLRALFSMQLWAF